MGDRLRTIGHAVWSRFLGVRIRSAIAAVIVVAIALAGAGFVFIQLYQASLRDGVTSAAEQRAKVISDQMASGGANQIAVVLSTGNSPRSLVQITKGRTVVASSAGAPASHRMTHLHPSPGKTIERDTTLRIGTSEDFYIVATGVQVGLTSYVVQVAQSLEPVESGVNSASALLFLGYPLLLVVVGAATFVFVGTSLRPVEDIRRRTATITASDLTARVPVPRGTDEVNRLATTVNQMLDRLESSVQAQRHFVADASHELRSPLSTVTAGLEILQAHPDDADSDATMRAMYSEAKRLETLIGDLLLLARSDERGLTLRREEVDLDDLVFAERRRIRALQVEPDAERQQRPTPTLSTAAVPVRVEGDVPQLTRVLRNLVDNAMRHARSAVSVRLAAEDGQAVLEVSDDGPGIPTELRERVFDRFVRLDNSRERTRGGAGLGLSIVREIVLAHDGIVRVVDTGVGATFRVVLPMPAEEPTAPGVLTERS